MSERTVLAGTRWVRYTPQEWIQERIIVEEIIDVMVQVTKEIVGVAHHEARAESDSGGESRWRASSTDSGGNRWSDIEVEVAYFLPMDPKTSRWTDRRHEWTTGSGEGRQIPENYAASWEHTETVYMIQDRFQQRIIEQVVNVQAQPKSSTNDAER